ncbi:hypothetical protein DYB32_002414 [Aphanomyces invadans]|uniref:Mitochondrial carrier protein n=1 Tax=Aphanomyces invadans TaxID=157072 RepID=A0A418B3H0_9STRA|nr:hypothetical protein DYB32_002414 [Aphanomyces invadans]
MDQSNGRRTGGADLSGSGYRSRPGLVGILRFGKNAHDGFCRRKKHEPGCDGQSVFGLWRGILPNLLGVVPARAAYFGCYAKLKASLCEYGFTGTTANFASASAAGCLTASVLSPIFVIKTRMQLMPVHTISLPSSAPATISHSLPRFHSMHEVALDMYRREGIRSFFKGLSASYWGVSEGAIQLALYEELKSRLGDEPSKPQLFVLAGVCKLVAAAATYPHEVVRTRLRDQRTPTDGSLPRYRSMFQALNVIYQSEGRRGLYGGMPAHLMKTVPNAAIMYVVLEMVVDQHQA